MYCATGKPCCLDTNIDVSIKYIINLPRSIAHHDWIFSLKVFVLLQNQGQDHPVNVIFSSVAAALSLIHNCLLLECSISWKRRPYTVYLKKIRTRKRVKIQP